MGDELLLGTLEPIFLSDNDEIFDDLFVDRVIRARKVDVSIDGFEVQGIAAPKIGQHELCKLIETDF